MGKILLLSLGVVACALDAQVTLTTTPSTLTYTYQSGAVSLPKAQTFSIKASAGTATYTTAIAPATAYWVTASPNAGTLPGTISVAVNPTSLTVGQYAASVQVTVVGVAAPAVVTVTLNVTAPAATLTLSPTTLTFTSPPPTSSQPVSLVTDNDPVSFTATSGTSWLTVSPTVGVVFPGDTVILSVAVDSTLLSPQVAPYTGKITVVASGSSVTTKSQNITVNLTVDNLTPTITNIWPASLPVNAGPQTLTIYGTNFYSATLAMVQGITAPLTTTLLSPTALLAAVPANMLTIAGNLEVYVQNPAPGGASALTAVPVTSSPVIYGVTNSASYFSTTVAPGELVTIFGSNIGPTTPQSLTITNGYVDTTLGNVSVLIDGLNAPILYVSANQVTVQVPYESTIGPGQSVILTNGLNPAASATVDIELTSPGFYSADGSGQGQAAALNISASGVESLNSITNPAKIGTSVSLYLTGEGDYAPLLSGPSNTGYVIPVGLTPLPELAPLPTVTIGGVDASAGVTYAGVVPGAIIGLLQLNVTVPAGSSTGAAVPVLVTIGGNPTQTGVTLSIHP